MMLKKWVRGEDWRRCCWGGVNIGSSIGRLRGVDGVSGLCCMMSVLVLVIKIDCGINMYYSFQYN